LETSEMNRNAIVFFSLSLLRNIELTSVVNRYKLAKF